MKCDVTDEDTAKGAVAFAVEKYGRLDIMVNNAGISAETRRPNYDGKLLRIHETPVSMLDQTYQINIRGVWLGTKYACAQFLAQEPHPIHGRTSTGATADVHRGGSSTWAACSALPRLPARIASQYPRVRCCNLHARRRSSTPRMAFTSMQSNRGLRIRRCWRTCISTWVRKK